MAGKPKVARRGGKPHYWGMDDLKSLREVSQAIDGLRASVASQFSYVKWTIGGLGAVMLVAGVAVFGSIMGLTGQVSRLEGRLDGIEKGVTRIESRLDALMARFSERREPKAIQKSGGASSGEFQGVEKAPRGDGPAQTIEKGTGQAPVPLPFKQ